MARMETFESVFKRTHSSRLTHDGGQVYFVLFPDSFLFLLGFFTTLSLVESSFFDGGALGGTRGGMGFSIVVVADGVLCVSVVEGKRVCEFCANLQDE